MQLEQVGEFGLIRLLATDTINDPATVVVGIGDDAAVFLPAARQLQLLTTDMLVENIHFDLKTTTPWQLGYKAIAVNLSDIAAMGGVPRQAAVSLALPRNTQVEFVANLYQGMKEICREFGVNIVGGDTVSSPQGLVINVVLTGEVEPANLVKRSGAQAGDVVIVTGNLGNSAAGLDILNTECWEEFDFARPLVTSHLTPRPQVKLGQLLAAAGASSMNDISDGLGSESHEIAKASGVGMVLYADRIPLSQEAIQAAAKFSKIPLNYALYGGEDYQLLVTMPPDKFERLRHQEQLRLILIGEVTEAKDEVILIYPDGTTEKIEPRGYNHFRTD
ncbi:thiamine-phosphate kinase [Methylomusa anaerophila]|uniref:Thiamine-monophosphate kinase n=1 Tax=Methylomusa anaerophila TaxID=1930071 RepID=A0A348AMK0_9FIRM|nr:thiamine-phosphate kinase [Methylomusa anaerophila]BBB92298.1 thiamine-monophosphate kinase [Methylomusa anaerophila]